MGDMRSISRIESELRSRILTPEGEILFFLLEKGKAKTSQIIKNSKYSHGCIFQKVRDLEETGLVVRDDATDKSRTPMICLSERAKAVLSVFQEGHGPATDPK